MGVLAAGGSAGTVKLKGNHPSELARLGAVVHADPAMESPSDRGARRSRPA